MTEVKHWHSGDYILAMMEALDTDNRELVIEVLNELDDANLHLQHEAYTA